ncbi:MAG: helix-turn-helix domain-containing protein [Desulforhopalus sp.]|jgi:cytoskeletal protein RodZ|nr:helix-turn-helix domain-containing protein [Desulforhopalus sp.]
MSQVTNQFTSLGQMLRSSRATKGLDMQAVVNETRISQRILEAMEADNYDLLPSKTYARGFYTLYARLLDLDVEQVLHLFEKEQLTANRDKTPHSSSPPFSQSVGDMAEPPSSLSFSLFGVVVFILLLLAGFLSWYFSWNPATFFSQQLRSLESPQEVVQFGGEPDETVFLTAEEAQPGRLQASTLPPVWEDVAEEDIPPSQGARGLGEMATEQATMPARYFVNAQFPEETAVRLIVDNAPGQHFTAKEGETMSWQAAQKLILTLPSGSRVRLTLNDVPIDIPSSRQQYVTIAIPESILR